MALTKKQEAIVKRWTAALRSKKYKQGRDQLHRRVGNKDSYCCLGVLCVLAVRARVIPKPELSDHTMLYGDDSKSLPPEVRQWAGLSNKYGMYDFSESLVNLNDNEHKNFASIAKIIDSKPEGLFV